jgi:hypothetical protein
MSASVHAVGSRAQIPWRAAALGCGRPGRWRFDRMAGQRFAVLLSWNAGSDHGIEAVGEE